MEYKSCFILMPFTQANELTLEDLDFVYNDILKKIVDEFEIKGKKYFQDVARYTSKVGSIVTGIVNQLQSADLVIADLTGLNANVMYELGVRHALKRGTIIVSQNLDKLPSDLRDYLTVGYSYSRDVIKQKGNYSIFKTLLHEAITEVIDTDKCDSPVLSYLQQRQQFRNEAAIDKLKENTIMYTNIGDEYDQITELIKKADSECYNKEKEPLYFQLFSLRFSNLITSLSELNIPHFSSIVYENLVNIKTLLNEMAKMFTMGQMFNVKSIPDFPVDFFNTTDLQGCFDRKFVDPFYLLENDEIQYITLRDVFKENGIFQEQILDHLEEYLERRSKELGVKEKELENIMQS